MPTLRRLTGRVWPLCWPVSNILRRQVSTRWPKLAEFREQLHQALADDERYVAVVEVCGFHDWLVKWLQQDERCHQALVVQPLGPSANKTDRRDANALSELLWVNRDRLLRGDRVQGVRIVYLPSVEQQADRYLTQLRQRLVLRRMQTLNQIHKILRRHNLEWERPTKTFQTRKVTEWLRTLPLDPMDRLAVDHLLVQWRLWEEQLVATDKRIAERFVANPDAQLLATMPGVSMFIALAIVCRIVPIGRFNDPHKNSPFLPIRYQPAVAFLACHPIAKLPLASPRTPLLTEDCLGRLDPLAGDAAGPFGEHGHQLQHRSAVGRVVVPRGIEQVERDALRFQGRVGIHKVAHAAEGPVEAHHDRVVAPAQARQDSPPKPA